jgi:hypothetical protein
MTNIRDERGDGQEKECGNEGEFRKQAGTGSNGLAGRENR